MKLYMLYYEFRHEVNKPPVFVCICRADQIEKINEHYSELFGQIIDPCPVDASGEHIPVERLTNDPILQGWESFEGVALLQDIETGERFYYWDKNDGYEIEPFLGIKLTPTSPRLSTRSGAFFYTGGALLSVVILRYNIYKGKLKICPLITKKGERYGKYKRNTAIHERMPH